MSRFIRCLSLPIAATFLLSLAGPLYFTGLEAQAQSLEEVSSQYLESPAGGPTFSEAEQHVIEKTNQFRAENGLEPVRLNEKLAETAAYFAAYMAHTGEFSHTADGNQPSDRASLFDYEYCIVSENIGMQRHPLGFSTEQLAEGFFDGWLNSPDHREAMIDPHVSEIGVAIAKDPESQRFYSVQMFGRPKADAFRFKIANRTDQTVRYVILHEGADDADAQEMELPPRAIRAHIQCRPVLVDWDWTDEPDRRQVEGNIALVITGSGDDLEVQEDTIENATRPIQIEARGRIAE